MDKNDVLEFLQNSNYRNFKKSRQRLKEKLVEYLTEQYDDLNDTLEYDEFIEQLGETYGVYIGDIYDITEF